MGNPGSSPLPWLSLYTVPPGGRSLAGYLQCPRAQPCGCLAYPGWEEGGRWWFGLGRPNQGAQLSHSHMDYMCRGSGGGVTSSLSTPPRYRRADGQTDGGSAPDQAAAPDLSWASGKGSLAPPREVSPSLLLAREVRDPERPRTRTPSGLSFSLDFIFCQVALKQPKKFLCERVGQGEGRSPGWEPPCGPRLRAGMWPWTLRSL